MKGSITLVFSTLFMIVLAVYVLLSPREELLPVHTQNTPTRLLELDRDDSITLIQIQRRDKNETITLERVKDKWMFKSPVMYPADNRIVDGLVSALTLSTKARRLTRQKGWDEYGLLKPSLKIGIQTKQVLKRRYLYLGDRSPVADAIFARWEGEQEYFLVDPNLKKVFGLSVYSLRAKQVFRSSLENLSRIQIHIKSGNYEMEKQSDGKWLWLEPIPILGETVPDAQVGDVIAQLQELFVKDFLDQEKKSRDEAGLSSLSPYVRLWGKGDNTETLRVGGEIPTRDSFYGMLEGENVIFLVARTNINNLFKTAEAIAHKNMPPVPEKKKAAAVSSVVSQ